MTGSDAESLVRRFLELATTRRAAEAVELLHPDVEWRNSGWPTIRGRRVAAMLRDMDRRGVGFEVEMHHLAAEGDVVLTERTDILGLGRWRTSFHVNGTFRVREGRVVLWDDHFSNLALVAGGIRGLSGLLRRP